MRETARLIDVPESTYRQWEYGQAILGEPYPFIAKAFNVTLDELFGVQDQEATIEGDFNRISHQGSLTAHHYWIKILNGLVQTCLYNT